MTSRRGTPSRGETGGMAEDRQACRGCLSRKKRPAAWASTSARRWNSTSRAPRCPAGLPASGRWSGGTCRSEEHTSELQSRLHLVCRLLLEKKKEYKL